MTKLQSTINSLSLSSPGRICLFGEHQDYLSLPVISAAISLRITVSGTRRTDDYCTLRLPDIGSRKRIKVTIPHRYRAERDYFRSSFNVLRRHGYTFSTGFTCEVHSAIPISAGTSSSSALVVAWIQFLALMSDQRRKLPSSECARLAYQAEVIEFNEPGGMMDHYSSCYGGALEISFFPKLSVLPIPVPAKSFVLGDSGQPKNTKKMLSLVKNRIFDITKQIQTRHPGFSLHTVDSQELDRYSQSLDRSQKNLLRGTLRNRDITREAVSALRANPVQETVFSKLMNEQQSILRDTLSISTPKIDGMLSAALEAGALCGKINGSGGGGCMFAYAPNNPEQVAEAILRKNGKAFLLTIDGGTRLEMIR